MKKQQHNNNKTNTHTIKPRKLCYVAILVAQQCNLEFRWIKSNAGISFRILIEYNARLYKPDLMCTFYTLLFASQTLSGFNALLDDSF